MYTVHVDMQWQYIFDRLCSPNHKRKQLVTMTTSPSVEPSPESCSASGRPGTPADEGKSAHIFRPYVRGEH